MGGRSVGEARRARGYPKPKHSQHLGNRPVPSPASSFRLQLPRSCSTCSSSPGQVVGVVKQSPPPRRGPRFGPSWHTVDQQEQDLLRARGIIIRGIEEWLVQQARGKEEGKRCPGWKGWVWTSSIHIYIYIERTRIEADYARELAKSWRKFDHEACPYFDHSYFDRIMRRRFFFRDPSRRYVEFAPTFVTIGFTDLLVRLRVRVLAINGSRLYRVT